MKVRVIIISVCANLVLAGFAVHLRTRDLGQAAVPVCASASQLVTNPPETLRVSVPQENKSAPFHWSSLESTNFEVYVANLRAVGCPESTVQDIVFGEFEDLYTEKQFSGTVAVPFWSCGVERSGAEERERLRLLELARERGEWLKRLFGTDVRLHLEDSDWVNDFQQYGIGRALLGPAPRETLLSMFSMIKRFETAESELRDGTGLRLPEDTERVRQSLLEECEKVKKLMLAEQFVELSARCIALRSALESKAEERFTSQDLRAIARMQVEVFGPERIFLEDFPLPDESERKQKFEQGLREYLGDARYERYILSQDRGYRQVLGFTQEQGFPAEVATALSAAQKVLQEEATKVREDSTISSRERRMLLSQMQTEVQAQAGSLLGQTSYGHYLGQGGDWLTNAIVLP